MTSLRVRLLVVLLTALVSIASAMAWATYRSVLSETETLFDYQLRQMALSLRDQGEVSAEVSQTLINERLDFVVQIWSVDGRILYASVPHVAVPSQAQLGLAEVLAGNQWWRTYSVATPLRVIQVAQPVAIRRGLAAEAAWRSVMPLTLLAPLLGMTMWVLVSWTLRPLQRVANEVRARDAGSLALLPVAHLPDEVAPLVTALNDLLQRLGDALSAQRAFVADAAHELRSPLTALKLQLHVLAHARDGQDRQHALTELAEGMDRASRLVEQLLALARSEPGAPPLPLAPLDLSALSRDTLAALAPLAQSRGARLSLLTNTPVWVQGNVSALTSLVRNLVDNAIRHSPRGAQVDVAVEASGGQATLTVDDAGPGLPLTERERAFDRFYRRAADSEPGSGLGLAIVRSVAQRHGAQVKLSDAPLGGLRVSVRLAVLPAEVPA